MTVKSIPYGKQEISEEDINAIIEILRGDFLTQGPTVAKFETNFKEYVQADYSVAVANGTAALHLATKALTDGGGKQKVITSPLTFAATANAILYNDAEVIFCDVDPDTGLISFDEIERILNGVNGITGVIPIDYAGIPVDTQKLRALIGRDRWILEDACHAPGAYNYNSEGQKIYSGSCSYADAAIFSFHPVKHIATGEGGMVTCRSSDLDKKVRLFRTHGITKDPDIMVENHGGWYYEMHDLGFNYRLTDIQAALGVSQLKRAEAGLNRRHEIARIYHNELSGLPLILPKVPQGVFHAFHLYVIRTERRKELYDFLHSKNIRVQVHYIPLHLQPYYAQMGFKRGQFPNAEFFYEQCLSLPIYPSLTDNEQDYVIEAIKSFFK